MLTIYAEVHSDDWVVDAEFDAVPWFEQATDNEITNLADIGWRGDYAADAVAEHFDGIHGDVTFVMRYVASVKHGRGNIGFECSVDAEEAMTWLEVNRPGLYKVLAEAENA